MSILSQQFQRKLKSGKQHFLPLTNIMRDDFLQIFCSIKQLPLCHTLLNFVAYSKLLIFIKKKLHLGTNVIMKIIFYQHFNMDFAM